MGTITANGTLAVTVSGTSPPSFAYLQPNSSSFSRLSCVACVVFVRDSLSASQKKVIDGLGGRWSENKKEVDRLLVESFRASFGDATAETQMAFGVFKQGLKDFGIEESLKLLSGRRSFDVCRVLQENEEFLKMRSVGFDHLFVYASSSCSSLPSFLGRFVHFGAENVEWAYPMTPFVALFHPTEAELVQLMAEGHFH